MKPPPVPVVVEVVVPPVAPNEKVGVVVLEVEVVEPKENEGVEPVGAPPKEKDGVPVVEAVEVEVPALEPKEKDGDVVV